MSRSCQAHELVEKLEERLRSKGREIKIYRRSITTQSGIVLLLIREGLDKKFVMIYREESDLVESFKAEEEGEFDGFKYRICPCNHENALALRRYFPYTRPSRLAKGSTVGMGDRIGVATPGHIRAAREFGIFPALAQQSIREMGRTGRSPEEVLDDVSWAVFQEGYRDGFAADADHLKTLEDIDRTFKAGFTMYTLDPSDYVDDLAGTYDPKTLREKFEGLPWKELGCDPRSCLSRYVGPRFRLRSAEGEVDITFSEEALMRSAVKYSKAIAHILKMYNRLVELFDGKRFDLEISVDETTSPTTPQEHFFIASELKRLGVKFDGLALRFVGAFEKAVDYRGDLKRFEEIFKIHVIIAKSLGPYKLSIHSGSDKFSIYPIIGKWAKGMFHLKTAGTSYLEALRVVARHDPRLFREIIDYSMKCFERDKATYMISTKIESIPDHRMCRDEELEDVFLNRDEGRQLLHVTYGSILTARDSNGRWIFRDKIRKILLENEEEYYQLLQNHFRKHLMALGLKG